MRKAAPAMGAHHEAPITIRSTTSLHDENGFRADVNESVRDAP